MTGEDSRHESTTKPSPSGSATAAGAGGVVTIMHADVEGSTSLTARAGDEVGRAVLSETKRVVQEQGEANGGSLIDAVGDAMMLTFASTRSAIVAAMAIQSALAECEAHDPDESTLRVRIGLNAGEVVGHDATPFGAAINAGARVMSMAEGGEILVSDMVRRLAGTIPGVEYRDCGSHRFKGFDEPWRLYQVVWEGAPAPRPREPRKGPARRTVAAAIAAALAVAAVAVSFLLRGGGSVDVGTDSVARLDGASGKVRLSAEIGQRPGATVVAFDSLWVAQPDRGVVARLSLEDGTVRDTIRVGASPSGLTAGAGSVWVANGADGTVSRINPEANEATQTLQAGSGPAGIAYGDGALWVADSLGASLVRLDPATGTREVIPLAGRPAGVAFTPTGVWISFEADGVARVDARRRSVTFTKSVGNGPADVLHAFDSIWVSNHLDGTVSRLDPATGRQRAVITVGDGPGSLAAVGGRLWVANEFDDTLTAIDPAAAVARETVEVGSSVVSLAAGDRDLWLAAGASATEHRGGTLRVSSQEPRPKTLDSAVVYDPTGWQILSNTGDGLMAYKKTGGPAGATLVPDLASAPPEISPDGLTLRFPLRAGIRYATGEAVRPEDYRRGLERAVALSEAAAALYEALRGAGSCAEAKAGCDLSRSIITDDEAVTFRLARPDPDFPFKLALPFAFPVPVEVPMSDQRLTPIPSTGPYVIAKADGGSVRLERNTSFEEWSRAAQPDGFVDVIDWRFGERVGDAFVRLRAGAVDVMASPPAPDDVSTLQTASPNQMVVGTESSTLFVGVDVLRPPFDDVRVRRALNYAIDRERVVELAGGPGLWRATCQIFSPNLQGYQPFCPYTVDPEAGVWSAPALERARTLVRMAGAQGEAVLVSAAEIQPGLVAVMRHVVDVLNAIGLRAMLEVEDEPHVYLDRIYRGPARPGSAGFPQVYLGGWVTDYPRASDYIEPQFRCDAPVNVSGYCNPRLDASIDRAKELSSTSPGAADRAWTAIEHQLVREAIWTPLFNRVRPHAFSARTGNVQIHPQWGVLLSRAWVR